MNATHPAIKALNLALASSAGDGEAKAAILGFLRIARAAKWCVADVASAIGGGSSSSGGFGGWKQKEDEHSKRPSNGWGPDFDEDDEDDEDDGDDAPTRSPLCDVVFPFGKYKGSTMAQIAKMDFGYLRWIATKFGEDGDPFRTAANVVINFMSEGGVL